MVFRREGKGREGKGEAGIAGVASKAYVWLWITYPLLCIDFYEAKRLHLPGVFSVAFFSLLTYFE